MTEKRRNELKKLLILFIIFLFLSNGDIALYIRKAVFSRVTWEQIVLGLIGLRITYILLAEFIFGKKR